MDRVVRGVVAVVLVYAWYSGMVTGTLALVALVVAFVLAITAMVSSCYLYTLLGISTCKIE